MRMLISGFKTLILAFLFAFLLLPSSASAQETQPTPPVEEVQPAPPAAQRLEGVVTDIREEKEVEALGTKQLYQRLEVLVTGKNRKGETLTVESGNIPVANLQKYKVGDKIVINASENPEGKELLDIIDYVRTTPIYWLFAIFVGLTALIGRKRGIASLVGMGLSFVVIFAFVLPQILEGRDPILIAIAASMFIIPVTFYLSHGFNKKTTSAVIGTIISLVFTGILANLFVGAAKLTGFGSEEASFLQAARPDVINIRGLLLAGIIVGVLGILDDITVSQAAIVDQLKQASPKMPFAELFGRTMDIGRDHIASAVNTLILVYTGAAMPLLLLFANTPQPFAEVINTEIVAEEVVRTLVASIGLILAVPVTTSIAALVVSGDLKHPEKAHWGHAHE